MRTIHIIVRTTKVCVISLLTFFCAFAITACLIRVAAANLALAGCGIAVLAQCWVAGGFTDMSEKSIPTIFALFRVATVAITAGKIDVTYIVGRNIRAAFLSMNVIALAVAAFLVRVVVTGNTLVVLAGLAVFSAARGNPVAVNARHTVAFVFNLSAAADLACRVIALAAAAGFVRVAAALDTSVVQAGIAVFRIIAFGHPGISYARHAVARRFALVIAAYSAAALAVAAVAAAAFPRAAAVAGIFCNTITSRTGWARRNSQTSEHK